MKKAGALRVSIVVRLAVLAAVLLISTLVRAQEKKEFTVVQLIVNVLKGATLSDADIEATVKEANKILKQAAVRLEFDKDKDINHEVSDQGNNDGIIDAKERQALDKASLEEVEKRAGKGKGYKVIVTKLINIPGLLGATGASPHNPDAPITYLKHPSTFIDNERRGNVLAHEFSHVFTLGKNHKITATLNADDTWHHPTDKKNLMYAQEPLVLVENGKIVPGSRGSELTEDQRKEIHEKAKKRGDTKMEISLLEKTKHGSWVNVLNPDPENFLYPASGTLYAEAPHADLQLAINLAGLYPETEVHTDFLVLFDTDDNPETGVRLGSFIGIDKIVTIAVRGRFPFTGLAGSIDTVLLDFTTDTIIRLEPGIVERVGMVGDPGFLKTPTTLDVADTVQQAVPLDALDLSADEVPMGVIAFDFRSDFVKDVAFTFPFNPPPGPQVQASVTRVRPGASVTVQGRRFAPNSAVTLRVDDTQVASTETSRTGRFSQAFVFPDVPPGDYFVTARDAGGNFDFLVLPAG